jgi:hypothetical protein
MTHLPSLPAPGHAGTLLLLGAAGRIETLIALPVLSSSRSGRIEGPATDPIGFAVICHPHPLHGGALSNKVTYALASCALQCGLAAVRFNFRGVGKSQGAHDGGRGETEDTLAVIAWMRAQLPGAKLLLAGFSFGAFVSLKAAARAKPALQVSIAPPFKYFADEPLPPRQAQVQAADKSSQLRLPPRPPAPWLVVHGLDDEVVDYAETQQALSQYQPPPELVTMDGVGHFFHGRLNDLQDAVTGFIRREWGKN